MFGAFLALSNTHRLRASTLGTQRTNVIEFYYSEGEAWHESRERYRWRVMNTQGVLAQRISQPKHHTVYPILPEHRVHSQLIYLIRAYKSFDPGTFSILNHTTVLMLRAGQLHTVFTARHHLRVLAEHWPHANLYIKPSSLYSDISNPYNSHLH
jgi:hypothetical protein